MAVGVGGYNWLRRRWPTAVGRGRGHVRNSGVLLVHEGAEILPTTVVVDEGLPTLRRPYLPEGRDERMLSKEARTGS